MTPECFPCVARAAARRREETGREDGAEDGLTGRADRQTVRRQTDARLTRESVEDGEHGRTEPISDDGLTDKGRDSDRKT